MSLFLACSTTYCEAHASERDHPSRGPASFSGAATAPDRRGRGHIPEGRLGTRKSDYTGPLASDLNSVDVSWVVGAVVTAVAYWLLTRNLDVRKEQAAIAKATQGYTKSRQPRRPEPEVSLLGRSGSLLAPGAWMPALRILLAPVVGSPDQRQRHFGHHARHQPANRASAVRKSAIGSACGSTRRRSARIWSGATSRRRMP